MLNINWSDVINVLNTLKVHLIVIAAAAVLAIIVIIAVKGMARPAKFLARAEAGLAFLVVLAVVVNLICFGPMSTLISLATGSGRISDETSDRATALCTEIAEEGIVLLKNDGAALPLTSGSNLNVFGWASTNPCYGGTGSGSLNQNYHTVSLIEGLESAGFKLNKELSDFYTSYHDTRPAVEMFEQDWTLPEPNVSAYSSELIANAKAHSDTALVVITRVGGEGADLPTDMSSVTYDDTLNEGADWDAGDTYLSLTNREEELIDLVCENFSKVIIVYNGANAIELGSIADNGKVQGLLWCPGTGQSGFTGLGELLSGAVNPSGRTADTFVRDLTSTPYFNNIGSFTYENMTEYPGDNFGTPTTPTFVNYVEGIYVGYKWYETAAKEGLIDYDESVVYPFGYGLSYTSFQQEMGPISESGGTISFDVTVTNTGSVAGKDVVEVYYDPPYTNGGIEKASANLVAFAKTDTLEPGKSEIVNISFQVEDMASYDAYGAGCYVLEAGDYEISINTDSHNVIDSQTYTVDSIVTYRDGRSTDDAAAVNQFSFAEGNVTYLSRKDGFANYAQVTAAPDSMTLTEEYKATFLNNSNYDPSEYNDSGDTMPTTGAKNGLKLVDLRGVSYDDAQWEQLLDQLSVSDMDSLIALAGFQTQAIASVDKVGTVDCDGPASINNNFTQQGSIGFPSAVMIASTWNQDIVRRFGDSIGTMADEMGVSGWYGPAMNTHRSAFAGRNFEYYSEDSLLSGKMAASAVAGAREHGVYAYLKHFALNDQETNRNNMICTWSNEQAIREIYLKPFELAVKEGGAQAIMSSFNYIGTTYAGACSTLLNTVLRDEWGFRGMVLTDYYGVYGYQDADSCIRNGNDCCLVNYDTETNHVTDTTSATSVLAMRQASKNILYTVANSRAYAPENLNSGLEGWKIAAIVIDVVLAAVVIVLEVLTIKGYNKRKQG